MEIVVLNSDIARLVLDYLKSQKLKKATHTFCKTSPYLRQEFSAYKQGLQTHSFFPELEEIICEYVKISRKVEELLPKLTDNLRSQLQQSKLSEKVNELLDLSSQATLNCNLVKSSTTATTQKCNSADDKESNKTNRKRSFGTLNNSLNEEVGNEIHRKRDKVASYLENYSKKRRTLQPYCFLSAKASQRHKSRYYTKGSIASTDEDYIEDNESLNSIDGIDEASDGYECDGDDYSEEKEIFDGERPTKESTPRTSLNKKGELVPPILPGISQAILDNPEFQQKLVENINQALNHSNEAGNLITNVQKSNEVENADTLVKGTPISGEEITSSQLLDQMVKNILEATEKEPSFNDIIQDVVAASNKPQVQSAAVQCNINNTNLAPEENIPLFTTTEPPPQVPALPVTQLQQYVAPTSPTLETVVSSKNMPTMIIPPPRTPIMLRSAAGAITANTSVNSATGLSAQDPPSLLGSNSFSQLSDPNFSISKLIVLNSNDSAQKQPSESCIGNTTADNLISQISANGMVDLNDEQVYFDTASGQLTFLITNDGIVTNFPFLINNDYVNQQLQINNIGNSEVSRQEIPLYEPIVVSANQLPPNPIIFSSVQKGNLLEKPETAEKNTKEAEIKHYNSVPPASLENRLLYDKATPSSNGIVNTKAFKSLSTPRKRTSHVRTLTFSPRGPQTLKNVGTPLSTRRDALCLLPSSLPKDMVEEIKEKDEKNTTDSERQDDNSSEKPVIKAVEILPSLANATSETLTENTNISSNETGNIPPLFVNEESSNQTIINKNAAASKESLKDLPAVAAQLDNTPKRKQFTKTAVRSCKRQLSKSSNEPDSFEEKAEKENEKTTMPSEQTDNETNMMKEWIRLRNSNVDLDVRLREINASSQSQQIKKVNTKKRVRRRKPAAIKKKEKELVQKAAELERSKELRNEVESIKSNEILETAQLEQISNENLQNAEIKAESVKLTENKKEVIIEQTKRRLQTKIKSNKKCKGNKKGSDEPEKQSESPDGTCQILVSTEVQPAHINEALEREIRTTNIAFLLETPFKDPNLASCNPPTPGIFAPSLETPSSKQKDPHDEMQASASFLFGSITKSELDTPLATAITPGFRFTPFGLKDIGTPKSVPGTDYSSGGGSYYKPDESEDLDRNIDKMLRAKSKVEAEIEINTDFVEQIEEGEIVEEQGEENENEIEIEIPVEKLKVEPNVLRRVKSFGTENVDCVETTKIDPHYTLVSGLPEISAAEDECSSSSSSSSGSSSSSSSSPSSSSSSSSSSTSSSSSNSSVKSKTVVEMVPSSKTISINDLENLSEISSTEDEEWQKLVVTDNDENSQLVNNDGEVRYPVRSWLTPIKENTTIETKTTIQTEVTETTTSTKPATIKVTLPLKSAEKRHRQVKELELKKQRLKEKLKNDANTITKKDKPSTSTVAAPNISAALAASRMIHAMRDSGKKTALHQNPLSTDTMVLEAPPLPGQEKRSLDVLTALNLSAIKHLPKTPENKQKLLHEQSAGDNILTNSPNNLKGKQKVNVSPSTPNKATPQRKCLPIEARPVTRTIRRKSGKKIVRTPLAFKVIHSPGKINSRSTTTTLAELAATKTRCKSKDVAAIPIIHQTLRVSPRLMKPSKLRARKKSSESPTPKSKVSTRSAKAKTIVKPKTSNAGSRKKIEPAQPPGQPLESNYVEELEDDTAKQKAAAATVKPKINLKARNAMISTKQKTILKKELSGVASKKELKKIETKTTTLQEEQQTHTEPTLKNTCLPQQTANVDPQTLKYNDNVCFNGDDDDPLEDCEMATIDEDDTMRFIKFNYNGPDGPPTIVPKPHDFSNFQMVVAIDENEKHTWRITEGICLFSCAPSLSKPAAVTIAKKKKVRTTTVTTIMSETASTTAPTATTSSSITKMSASKTFSTNSPVATSTPVTTVQASNSKTVFENGKTSRLSEEGWCKSRAIAKQESGETNKKSLPETNSETPKIQIEDIESILSHLHGT